MTNALATIAIVELGRVTGGERKTLAQLGTNIETARVLNRSATRVDQEWSLARLCNQYFTGTGEDLNPFATGERKEMIGLCKSINFTF